MINLIASVQSRKSAFEMGNFAKKMQYGIVARYFRS